MRKDWSALGAMSSTSFTINLFDWEMAYVPYSLSTIHSVCKSQIRKIHECPTERYVVQMYAKQADLIQILQICIPNALV